MFPTSAGPRARRLGHCPECVLSLGFDPPVGLRGPLFRFSYLPGPGAALALVVCRCRIGFPPAWRVWLLVDIADGTLIIEEN